MNKLLLIILTFVNLSAFDAFVSPSDLEKSLDNDNLIIIDVDSSTLYNKSHIQNALHLDINKFINHSGSYIQMNSSDIIQDEMRELGINTNSQVVIYAHNTDVGFLNTSYLAMTLIRNGFENVSILNGGYMAWIFEFELLTATEANFAQEDGNVSISNKVDVVVDFNYIKEHLYKIKILDARSPEAYFGTIRSNNISNVGHIPSASSSYYKDMFNTDGTLREYKELEEIVIAGHEISKDDEVIVYADDIFKASMDWYILYKYMNITNTKIYEASLLEWGNYPELPMIRFKWE